MGPAIPMVTTGLQEDHYQVQHGHHPNRLQVEGQTGKGTRLHLHHPEGPAVVDHRLRLRLRHLADPRAEDHFHLNHHLVQLGDPSHHLAPNRDPVRQVAGSPDHPDRNLRKMSQNLEEPTDPKNHRLAPTQHGTLLSQASHPESWEHPEHNKARQASTRHSP